MNPSERYDVILQMLSTKEMVTIPELIQTFDVSIETVRRDLNYLAKEKLIKKVYGGAILFNRPTSDGRGGSLRMSENASEKAAIGQRCAQLINDGDTLFMGPGTTVRQVARHLKNHKKLTVITSSLYVVAELLETDTKIYLIGGEVNNRDAAIATYIPQNSWDFFSPPKAVIGVGGISAKYGITDFNVSESRLLKDILDRAMSIIVTADNSKFGLVHPCITCPLPRVSRIITGGAQKEELLQDFAAYRQRFLFVEDYDPDAPVDDIGFSLQ